MEDAPLNLRIDQKAQVALPLLDRGMIGYGAGL
jgi:hypothetical protein